MTDEGGHAVLPAGRFARCSRRRDVDELDGAAQRLVVADPYGDGPGTEEDADG